MSTPNDRDFFSTLGQPGGGVNQPVDGDAVDAGEPKHQATNGIHHDAPAPDTDTGHVNGLQQARPPHFGAMSSSGPAGLNPPTGPQPQLPQPPQRPYDTGGFPSYDPRQGPPQRPAGESTGSFPAARPTGLNPAAASPVPPRPTFDPEGTQIMDRATHAKMIQDVQAFQAGAAAAGREVITPASFNESAAPQRSWQNAAPGQWPGNPPPMHPVQQQPARRSQTDEPVGHEGLAERLRAGDLVTPAKAPATRGWRYWLYRTSFKTINVGASPDELYERELIAQVGANLRGTYTVAVLGGKGGSGKTSITTTLASMIRSHRSDPVVAIDADPAEGANLADRIDPRAASVRAILGDRNLNRYTDMRSLTGQNSAGLDVVASPQHNGASTTAITPEEFSDAHARLSTFYNILLVDSGQQLGHAVMPAVLKSANAIVVVASADTGGSAGADTNLKWLVAKEYHELLSRMVVVINHHRPAASRRDRKATAQLVQATGDHFRRRIGEKRVFVLPFDEHLATSAVVNLDDLNKTTRRRLLEIGAALSQGFSTTSDTK
ncbi:MinD/ParA family ATP-binding protein [Mycolicibacterium aubagnense]|uniref:CobQ/CobB/MinD/ParA nucleotide binding domain-containing protein n=1 Tax=Mycolicibacterium aubagnense TaxID=319707 RepID=A0ABN5Z253_9MYCO|nr:MinD/ParA family protein [Mycolicibacterium aubagnense]TLH49084.1 hypothetical protein C1S80_29130 [Mycolicibacterium aubagnense]BBX88247.1 hypothetical protein MAUB_64480 [Mycolicibacterium aubagnense]